MLLPATTGAMSTATASVPALSLHQLILADVEQRIVSGQWPPGHRIPSELELTREYDCSRMTVNKVLTQLARGGLLERRRKAGSFVMRPQSRSAVLEIRDIRAEVTALGLAYRHELITRHRRRSSFEKIRHRDVQDLCDLHQPSCTNAINAGLVFLHLLVGNAELVGEALQRQFRTFAMMTDRLTNFGIE